MKREHLTGAFYGPAVPPPEQIKPKSCFGCLCSTFLFVLLGFFIISGVLTLILWLVFRPVHVIVNVKTASLSQFNLTTVAGENNLAFNLTALVDIRNPNKRASIYYDRVQASGYYERKRFGFSELPSFHQGRRNTTSLSSAISGQSVIFLSESERRDFDLRRRNGSFEVSLELTSRIRLDSGLSYRTSRRNIKIICDMAISLDRPFNGSECNVRW